MALSVSNFRDQFPEFQNAPDTMIQSVITDVESEVHETNLGPGRASAVKYLVAHRLALSPWGQGTKLVTGKDSTTYGVHYQQIIAANVEGAALL